MNVHDVYGCSGLTLEECGRVVEEVLNVTLSPHCSEYYGDYLRACLDGGEEVRILLNYNGTEWHEEELKEYAVLIKVSDIRDSETTAECVKRLQPHFPLVMRSEVVPREWAKRYKFVDGHQVLIGETTLRTTEH
ncbi:MAG: hypothetical protein WAV95_19005 [Azonexus sp.]